MVGRLEKLPESTYIAVVRSLYTTLTPSFIMAGAFLAVGLHVALRTPDLLLIVLISLGSTAFVGRLTVLIFGRADADSATLDLAGARSLERRFAVPYLAFAATFGAFSARAFQVASADSHVLVIGLLFGYAAGVAAGIFLRPWIALPSIVLAVIPTSAAVLTTRDSAYVGVGVLLLLFLGGGVNSMMRNYRIAIGEITARRTFATLARADALTGLENRLSLREAFEESILHGGNDDLLAVHCLDLDRFKAVNDTYGHPIGDALLQAVSDRLRGILRPGDVAARFGGDEFVLLQVGVRHPGEAELLARRIAKSVGEPYSISGHRLCIGTSVGYALRPTHGQDLDDLVARADEALIYAKRTGGGIALYVGSEDQRLSA